MKVAEYLEEPESELQAFVPYHEIVDDDESSNPRFTIIFTTQQKSWKIDKECGGDIQGTAKKLKVFPILLCLNKL